jgi:hypothetical protein
MILGTLPQERLLDATAMLASERASTAAAQATKKTVERLTSPL